MFKFFRAVLLTTTIALVIVGPLPTEGQQSGSISLFCKTNLGSPIASSPASGDWPMFRQNPGRTGVVDGPADTVYVGSDDLNLFAINTQSCVVMWQFRTGGAIKSSPAVSANAAGAVDAIYVGSDDGRLYAVSPEGQLVWQFFPVQAIDLPPGAVRSSPIIAPQTNSVVFGSDDGHVYLVRNGQQQARFPAEGSVVPEFGAFRSSPLYLETANQFFVGSMDRNLYGFSAADTNTLINVYLDAPTSSSPAMSANRTIYVPSSIGTLYASRPDGVLQWQLRLQGDVSASPAVSDSGTIYIGTENGTMHAVKPNGTFLCSFEVFGPDGRADSGDESFGAIRSSPAIIDGYVIFGADDGILYVIEEETCRYRTSFGTRGPIRSSPLALRLEDRTRVMFGSGDGFFYILTLIL